MSRPVRVLRRAQLDLVEIRSYVERDRPSAAERLVDGLLDAMESLERMPDRGTVPKDERLRTLGFRVLVVSDHLIFHKVLPSQVRVYRVIHGRRKYGHLL